MSPLYIDEIFEASRFPSGRVVISCFQICTGLCVQMIKKKQYCFYVIAQVWFEFGDLVAAHELISQFASEIPE